MAKGEAYLWKAAQMVDLVWSKVSNGLLLGSRNNPLLPLSGHHVQIAILQSRVCEISLGDDYPARLHLLELPKIVGGLKEASEFNWMPSYVKDSWRRAGLGPPLGREVSVETRANLLIF